MNIEEHMAGGTAAVHLSAFFCLNTLALPNMYPGTESRCVTLLRENTCTSHLRYLLSTHGKDVGHRSWMYVCLFSTSSLPNFRTWAISGRCLDSRQSKSLHWS